ncbi:MAG: nucleoside deaminase [Paludibacteraceae bacterium]|nr:nucleoside deaminase [Paludibacteraceae bacterium]
MYDDTYYMKQALLEAQKAFDADEVPVGAIVVAGGCIMGRGHNLTETLNDATAHAEMLALTAAMNELGAKYLPDCTVYVTVEPCVMCSGAMYWAKIAKLVYGASEEKYGFTVKAPTSLHPKTEVVAGVMQEECALLMKEFFKAKR